MPSTCLKMSTVDINETSKTHILSGLYNCCFNVQIFLEMWSTFQPNFSSFKSSPISDVSICSMNLPWEKRSNYTCPRTSSQKVNPSESNIKPLDYIFVLHLFSKNSSRGTKDFLILSLTFFWTYLQIWFQNFASECMVTWIYCLPAKLQGPQLQWQWMPHWKSWRVKWRTEHLGDRLIPT